MIVKFQEHPLSFSAIARVIISLLAVYLVWKASQVLMVILVSTMLATALYPIAAGLNKKIPMLLSAFLVVLLLVLPFIIIAATVLPSLYSDFPRLLKLIDALLNNSVFLPESIRNIDFNQYAKSGGTYLLQSTGAITNFASSAIGIIVLTFFLIVDSERLVSIFLSLFSRSERTKIRNLLIKLGQINGQYIRGNLIVSLICGVVIYVGLTLLNIPYAMPIALFTAVMDLLPLVGALIGSIPAIILAFAISPITGLITIILYVVYQQIEGTVIAPAIYNKALNLSPSLSFLAVLLGTALFGVIGAFLALPFAASLPAITEYMHDEFEDK